MDRTGGAAAIVIGGAVAKGAFAAGALERVTEHLHAAGTPIRAVVGTSSGALNATVLAAGVRAGDPVGAARRLASLWEQEATLSRVLDLDLWSLLRGRGASGSRRIVGMLDKACRAMQPHEPEHRVALRIVMAPLAGAPGQRTSFEHVETFEAGDFGTHERRARVFQAAAASAAFPFAFAPVKLKDFGPCVDGGVVNNTPVKHAIERDPDIGELYVVVADPPDMRISPARAAALGGLGLLLRLLEMLVDERLVRDLEEARAANGWIDTLDRLERQGRLDRETRNEIISGLYVDRDPSRFRRLQLVVIRPEHELKGNPFAGFVSIRLRREYLQHGREAASRKLSERAGPVESHHRRGDAGDLNAGGASPSSAERTGRNTDVDR